MTKLNLIQNPSSYTTKEYITILEFLLNIKETLQKIIEVHSGGEEFEEIPGLNREESMSLAYLDEIESIDWYTYDYITKYLEASAYFPGIQVGDLFVTVMEETKYILIHMQTQINIMQPYNFDKSYKEDIMEQHRNLVYCLMWGYRMFDVRQGNIMVSFQEYCSNRNIDPVEMVNEWYAFYKANRPTMPLFEKYSELAVILETIIEEEYFEQLVQLSDYVNKSELLEIIDKKFEVDSEYIELLRDRMEGVE